MNLIDLDVVIGDLIAFELFQFLLKQSKIE